MSYNESYASQYIFKFSDMCDYLGPFLPCISKRSCNNLKYNNAGLSKDVSVIFFSNQALKSKSLLDQAAGMRTQVEQIWLKSWCSYEYNDADEVGTECYMEKTPSSFLHIYICTKVFLCPSWTFLGYSRSMYLVSR